MRTGRSLTVCCLVWGVSAWSGGCLPCLGGVCSQGVCSRGVSAPGRCLPGLGGLSAPGGCLLPGGCLPGLGGCAWSGGCLIWGGGYPSMHWGRHPSPPVDRHTLVKILPWPNFVAAGNYKVLCLSENVLSERNSRCTFSHKHHDERAESAFLSLSFRAVKMAPAGGLLLHTVLTLLLVDLCEGRFSVSVRKY